MSEPWTSPARFYDPNALRLIRINRTVYSEAEFLGAIGRAYKATESVSVIRLGANIVLKGSVVIDAPDPSQVIIIDGAGQFKMITSGGFSKLFDIRSAVKFEDVHVDASNVSSVFSVTGDVLVDLHGLHIATSNDGYVFDLPGSHWKTIIDNCYISDDGTLGSVFGEPQSIGWSASNIRLNGVVAGLFPADADPALIYQALRLHNLSYDADAGSLKGTFLKCQFSNLMNIDTIDAHNGNGNTWTNIAMASGSGAFTTGANDVVAGTAGYSITQSANSTVLGLAFADFAAGINIGLTTSTSALETFSVTNFSTTDATTSTIKSMVTDTGMTYYVEADVLAHQTNGTDQANAYKIALRVKNNGGTLTAGTPTKIYQDEEVPAWDATIDTSGTTIRIRVTGAVGANITWMAAIKVRRI